MAQNARALTFELLLFMTLLTAFFGCEERSKTPGQSTQVGAHISDATPTWCACDPSEREELPYGVDCSIGHLYERHIAYLSRCAEPLRSFAVESTTDFDMFAELKEVRSVVIRTPTDSSLEGIAQSTQIEALHLDMAQPRHCRPDDSEPALDMRLSEGGLKALSKLPKLTSLTITGYLFEESLLLHLKALTSLKHITLRDVPLNYRVWRYLSGHPSLETIDLSHTLVSDTEIDKITTMRTLQTIDLRDTQVTNRGVAIIKAALPEVNVFWDESPSKLLNTDGAVLWSNGLFEYKGFRAFTHDDVFFRGGPSDVIGVEGEDKDVMQVLTFDKTRQAILIFLSEGMGRKHSMPRQIVYLHGPYGLRKVFDGYARCDRSAELKFDGDGRVLCRTANWADMHEEIAYDVILTLDERRGELTVHDKTPVSAELLNE